MNQPDYRQQQEAEEQEWHERDRLLLNQIAEVTNGIVDEGIAWRERMKRLTERTESVHS